ncbi:hypothetical protein [Pedobacter sp.]|uniref:hypothetical protein n=1 Tax=Pedobacter sp. TaxID=1411316 RepID=UPI003D7F7A85
MKQQCDLQTKDWIGTSDQDEKNNIRSIIAREKLESRLSLQKIVRNLSKIEQQLELDLNHKD